MTERQPFVEKTVEELLFTGYEDPLFTRLHHLLPTTPERMGFFFGVVQSFTEVFLCSEFVVDSKMGRMMVSILLAPVLIILEMLDEYFSGEINREFNIIFSIHCCFLTIFFQYS